MAKLSIVIPTYNEKDNIIDGYNRLNNILHKQLSSYDYELLYIDNCSNDGTKNILEELAQRDSKVKVIFNSCNVGWSRSSFYGIINATGDCVVLLAADMQEPPEKIIDFIKEWENGYKIVVGIKSKSQENKLMYFMRNCFYKFMNSITEINHIKQFMGFGLYDKSFIDVLRSLDDSLPYFRGIVAELGYKIKKIEYVQDKRQKGKTHFNFFKIYDLAMLGITSYSKILVRIATIIGIFLIPVTFLGNIVGLVLFFNKVIPYSVPLFCVGFFLMSLIIFFIGMVGEYVLNIHTRSMHRPLVIEEKRINFNE